MTTTTRKICVTAMGIALFVVLTLCLQVPVFENYYLCLGYVVMTVFCCYFGPFSAMAVGGLGVVLYCLLTNGLRGMPGWAVGNLFIGLMVGLTCKYSCKLKNKRLSGLLVGVSIVVSTAAAMLGIKSLTESFLYAQPFVLRVAKNSYAFVADAAVMLLSLPVCHGLRGVITKTFPEEIIR